MKKIVLILTVIFMISVPVATFAVDHDNPYVVNPKPPIVRSK